MSSHHSFTVELTSSHCLRVAVLKSAMPIYLASLYISCMQIGHIFMSKVIIQLFTLNWIARRQVGPTCADDNNVLHWTLWLTHYLVWFCMHHLWWSNGHYDTNYHYMMHQCVYILLTFMMSCPEIENIHFLMNTICCRPRKCHSVAIFFIT